MSKAALSQRLQPYLHAAALAAHASAESNVGFRQRELRFLCDLFLNWSEGHFSRVALHNTQILRYLEQLCRDGLARRITRKRAPAYRLTRPGLVELVAQLTRERSYERPEEFFFIYYFATNYRDKLCQLVKSEGAQFPYALQVELEQALDANQLLEREIRAVERALQKQEKRRREAVQSGLMAQDLFQRRQSLDQVAKAIDQRYPYDLYSQKPLSKLMFEIPADVREWELSTGTLRRAVQLWHPAKLALTGYLNGLRQLAGAR